MTRIEDFKTQYERELIYQETNANKRTIKGFVWFLLAVGLVWVLTMLGIFEVNKTLTSFAFFSNVLLYLGPFYLMLRGDLSKPWVKYYLLTFLCLTSAVIISLLSYHAVLLYVFPLMYTIHYRKRRLLWFSYFMNFLTVTVSSVLSFYYGICDLNILLQSQHTRSWYMALAAEGPLHIPFNEDPLFVILFYMIFPRAIIVLVFTVMMHYTISNNTNEVYRIAQLTYLKDMDASTNVFNKNKYEDMVSDYYSGINRIAVMFWDLNDLKEINDECGHATGDRTIQKLASILNSFSSEYCRTYRVGGDEFLMILDNPDAEYPEALLTDIRKRIKEANASDDVRIHAAVGLAYGAGANILDVVKEADTKMYECKNEMKQKA